MINKQERPYFNIFRKSSDSWFQQQNIQFTQKQICKGKIV